MKTALKKIGISFLLMAGMACAWAGPNREARQERRSGESLPASGNSASNQGNSSYTAPPAESRRNGKMSPEERRALRRQINEVGQDIYVPKR